MASLKEIKSRIQSVNGTLKITSAMKMVAAAKLHKATVQAQNMSPYADRLQQMFYHLVQTELSEINRKKTKQAVAIVNSPLMKPRTEKSVAIVAFASNSSLCGAFNSNVARAVRNVIKDKAGRTIIMYPVGRKIADAMQRDGLKGAGDFTAIAAHPDYNACRQLADDLCRQYINGNIDAVLLVYHHFVSIATQQLRTEQFLPLQHDERQVQPDNHAISDTQPYYIVEPNAHFVADKIIPELLRTRLYAALLDSLACEHAARSVAMQTATDNAQKLMRELTTMYNKSRQQAITNELLDIAGGMA